MNRAELTVVYDRSKIQERNRQLSVLMDIGSTIADACSLDTLLEATLSRVLDLFHFDAGRIYLTDSSNAVLRLRAWQGIDPGGLETVRFGEGFTGSAAESRSFLARRTRDLNDPDRVELLVGKGYEMIVCVPLVARDRVAGVMNLATHNVVEIASHTIDLLMIVGNQIAHAAESARLTGELVQRAQQLQEKKETIKFLTYSASHDLKSPAVAANGLMQRFIRDYTPALDDRGRNMCQRILVATRQILALTDRLNMYITSKEAALRIETFPLERIVETLRSEFGHLFDERGVCLRVPQPCTEVTGDKLGLTRFFQNCVDNAMRYGGPALSEVTLGCDCSEDQQLLWVRDDGRGMPRQEADKVFLPFHRTSSSKGTDGTGLGMAIVQEIAARHGGEAWVDSIPGGGTTFYISLPAGPALTDE